MKSLSLNEIDKKFSDFCYEHVHKHLPRKINKASSKIFYLIKLKFLVRLVDLRSQVHILHTKDLTILYIGDKTNLHYISSILSIEEPKKELLGEVFIWGINKKINQYNKNVDIILIKTDRFFQHYLQKKGYIIIPEWMETCLERSEPSEIFFKHVKESARDDIARKIKRYDFTYEITSDPQKFKVFYDSIYLPFILNRHRKIVLPEAIDYLKIKNMFERGELLLVKEKEEIVAGSIFFTYGKIASLMHLGVKLEPDYLNKGAGSAIYYFFIDWAKKQGFNLIKFGGARPFLEDGLFRYKRKWGLTIKISKDMYGIFGFKFCKNYVKQAIAFMEKNPFIYIEKDKLKAIIFLSEKISIKKIQEIWKKHYTSGLAELIIFTKQDPSPKIKSFVQDNYNGKIVLKNKFDLQNH